MLLIYFVLKMFYCFNDTCHIEILLQSAVTISANQIKGLWEFFN